MKWTALQTLSQIDKIVEESTEQNILIFKHSTRCSTSHMVLNRIDRSGEPWAGVRMYFLDLLRFRTISSLIETMFSVTHESPQLLVIRDREAVLHLSHFEIQPEAIGKLLA